MKTWGPLKLRLVDCTTALIPRLDGPPDKNGIDDPALSYLNIKSPALLTTGGYTDFFTHPNKLECPLDVNLPCELRAGNGPVCGGVVDVYVHMPASV